MLSHCSEIRFSGRLNSNLNPFHPTDSNTSNKIDIKWITGTSAPYFCPQRRSFANRPEIPGRQILNLVMRQQEMFSH